jgi:hypothetical protein
MKSRLQISGGKSMKVFNAFIIICILGGLFFTPKSYAGYSNGPRQLGEAVLDELLMGSTKFVIRVGSNGGTDKNSFKIDLKKEPGLSAIAPHYQLTIIRIHPDECKAIVDDGVLILFDLEKDLGLKGNFTYAITNHIYSSPHIQPSDESLFSIIEKYFTFQFPELKEVKPEPFDKFVMDHDYFTCYLPADWKLERDRAGDEKAGIFETSLTMPEKAKPEKGEKYFFPDPLIYAGYYSKNNQHNKTYESFIKDYEELALKREGSDKSRYEKPQQIKFNEKDANEITYEVYQEIPRGPLVATKFWLKAKFIVIKAKEGFYVLAYKSPQEFYDKYLPVF